MTIRRKQQTSVVKALTWGPPSTSWAVALAKCGLSEPQSPHPQNGQYHEDEQTVEHRALNRV